MNPLRTSQRSTFERSTGASPNFSLRRLRNVSASSPRARTCNHCCGAAISQSTLRPWASLDRTFQTAPGPRSRTGSGIFSARVAVSQPSAKTTPLYGSDFPGNEGCRAIGELRLKLARKILQQLYGLTVIIAHHLPVTTATSESRLHRVLKRHTHVQAFFTHEETMTLLKFQPCPKGLQSLLLPTPDKRVQLVWLELPVIDEPSSLLIPRPLARHQSMVVELVENLPSRVQTDVSLGRNNIVSGCSSLGQRLNHADGFLSAKEAG